MTEYISTAVLDVNGQSIDDFEAVTDKEVEIHKPVNLMNKTGFMGVTPRYGVDVDYVVPATGSEFDWKSVKDGRLSLEFDNGKRVTYTGVYVLKIGDVKVDGENPATRTIELGATDRIEE